MKVAIGSDHGGFDLKETVAGVIRELGYEVVDMGVHDRTSVDYPDYAAKVAAAVVAKECELGVLICGTGIGMSIAANKIHGIRAALCNEIFSAQMAREHNDANILCLGARVVGPSVAEGIVRAYLTSSFAGGRHANRVAKLTALDEQR